MTHITTTLTDALDDVRARYTTANPRSQERFRAAADTMPGGNTRTSLYYSPFPVTFTEGRGQYLTDLDGHRYLDLLGEYSAGLYGHSHPLIIEAARTALERGIALGGPNTYDAELAELITARFPSVELLRFTNSGTESNLMAISTARIATGRRKIMVFENGYHGSVLSFRGASPLNAPYPFVVVDYNDTAAALAQIEQHADDLAAVLLEPMLGGGGVIGATPEFVHALRAATEKHGVVFILDEVMTSRLAPGGLQERLGVRPDLTTFGKYLGGGFGFGAFGGARRLMQQFDPTVPGSLSHPGTFNNNTISMAAGAAGLSKVFTPEVAVALNERGDQLRAQLNELFVSSDVAMQATGIGSLLGIHFQREPVTRARDILPADDKRTLLHLELMLRGHYFARRSYIALSIAVGSVDLDGFLDALRDTIETHRALLN